ncbi:MAG: hypothetical protein GXP13_02690 [Gammaproteobacteria bacterium]|nr:hypothetical protein [Gammaproteobacteria bacterium]
MSLDNIHSELYKDVAILLIVTHNLMHVFQAEKMRLPEKLHHVTVGFIPR